MNTEHTKGPWIYGADSDEVITKNAALICDIAPSRESVSDEEADANARLIAAAPELLAALQKLLENAGDCLEVEAPSSLCDARAAIAKATGQ